MSAGYRAKTAVFNSVNITDLTRLNVRKGGQSYDLVGDASADVLDVFVDNIASDLTVASNDIAFNDGASIEVGDAASLVIVFEKRATGSAAAGGGNKTLTITAAVTASDFEAGTNGIGAGSISFRAPGTGTWS